jgi:hypothetical protein
VTHDGHVGDDAHTPPPLEPPWDSVVCDHDGDTWVRTPYGWWLVAPGTQGYEDWPTVYANRPLVLLVNGPTIT